ncbi:hypothetical protein CAPTEDRAFT_187180 [Capitella teleta]|uniref:Apple domain-containing protein n=1 Tax=Capitella teleta TaxID=283909 RepID=R7V8P9_CAPTE|nr:hypothetical protein CAPTEDRAFT_187180 [Capitella teleta]|eukprot:ELU15198.1 hypothetical protein CAPTEDRAFT_187180 [Capitella teleta]
MPGSKRPITFFAILILAVCIATLVSYFLALCTKDWVLYVEANGRGRHFGLWIGRIPHQSKGWMNALGKAEFHKLELKLGMHGNLPEVLLPQETSRSLIIYRSNALDASRWKSYSQYRWNKINQQFKRFPIRMHIRRMQFTVHIRKMHLKVLVWILICATEVQALQYSSDLFNVDKDVGLGFNYSAISSVTVDSQVACALTCSTNPCCLSVFWKPQSSNDNCRLFDAQFLPEFLTNEDKTVYFTRKEVHPRRNEVSSWATQADRVIMKYDHSRRPTSSPKECKAYCEQVVWCISFDHTPFACYLSAVRGDMVDAWISLPDSTYGARVCNQGA